MISPGLVVRAALYAIAAMLLNIVISILWVAFYSFAIEPGRNLAFYQSYADRTVPLVSLIAGIPLLLAAGWLIGRGRPGRAGLQAGAMVGIGYAVIDCAIIFAFAAGQAIPWGQIAVSYATKIAAGAFGGWIAARGARQPPETLPGD